MYIAETLSAFTAKLVYENIPVADATRAKHLMLDAVGIAFASSKYDFARRTAAVLANASVRPEGAA